ncbi:hypothetical protein I317_02998 [Kwoniella heveanensis CBS 569]|uniref:Inositolphosphorylceramide synthase subunit Kei1-domain-containing protein n=1 Tax=Kwoniella heveanensis BCC8398 TaxID=1296120 RepID=A0A1B9H0A1_9TREE|nr:hypothetical protein I316_01297 [Kwoniella heveanensis BCC8398]OCF43154.1 hypothetical protein I317_02998 [Kwoniella heveanensis CBS 569]
MKITPRLPRPGAAFNSFLGLLDIKLGAEIILLFGLINKVAGLYGLIVVFVGGSFTQLLYYAYSTATLFAFLWGLRVVKSESAAPTLLLSHLYVLDHLIATFFHYLFYQHYWYVVPHDGRRTANSQAQQDLIDLALSRGEIAQPSQGGADEGLDELRAALAGEIWDAEKGFAVWTLVFGWLLKIYFIFILYSYAAHLSSSTYHTLPLTFRGKASTAAHPTTAEDHEAEMRQAEEAAADRVGSQSTGKGKGKKQEDEDDFSWD